MFMYYVGGSKSVLRGSLGIRDHFPGDLLFHFYNGYFELWCFATNKYGTSVIIDVLIFYDH
jgi:hypothetical protein